MRLTYTDIKEAHFRNIGKAGQFSDTTLLEDFQYSLGQRYQMIFGTISEYVNQGTLTASTVAAQQYYYYPLGTVNVDSATITIGSLQYTLMPIYDQQTWNQLNAMTLQPTAIPQFIFPRKSDFGIWPIPQAVYTINFQAFLRDRNMLVDDYIAGTATLTNGSATLTGVGTIFTAAMVGRWFTVTDTSQPGQGYWYRIGAYVDTTHLTLETYWAGTAATAVAYRIGETPEIPEEGHIMLPWGTAADYYAGLRNDAENSARFDNSFWTGSMAQTSRNWDDKNIAGGLIGMKRKYEDRGRDNVIHRGPTVISPYYKIWSETIT